MGWHDGVRRRWQSGMRFPHRPAGLNGICYGNCGGDSVPQFGPREGAWCSACRTADNSLRYSRRSRQFRHTFDAKRGQHPLIKKPLPRNWAGHSVFRQMELKATTEKILTRTIPQHDACQLAGHNPKSCRPDSRHLGGTPAQQERGSMTIRLIVPIGISARRENNGSAPCF
jgi:hypothetical protein